MVLNGLPKNHEILKSDDQKILGQMLNHRRKSENARYSDLNVEKCEKRFPKSELGLLF